MEMRKYLKDLKKLSDESLLNKYGEYGLYNNYRVLINEKPEKIKEILNKSKDFNFPKNLSENTYYFNYTPGIIKLQLSGKIHTNPHEIGYKKMLEDFKSTITFHIDYKKDMKDISFKEAFQFKTKESRTAIKRCAFDLGNFLIKENLTFCIPESSKWTPEKNRDYSEMAKFIQK